MVMAIRSMGKSNNFRNLIKTVSQIAEKESSPQQKSKARSGGYQLDDMAAIERKLRLQKQKN